MTIPTKDTGGAAFPFPEYEKTTGNGDYVWRAGSSGMTLRDYFAAAALPAVAASALAHSKQFASGEAINKAIAENCYALADAMLKARGGE